MKKLLLLLVLLSVCGCDKTKVFSQYDRDFPQNRWRRNDVREYCFTIDEKARYDLTFEISHLAEFQFAEIPLDIEGTDPTGTVSRQRSMLKLLDAQRKDLGECSGDLCDLEQPLFENVLLIPGQYKVRIRHLFPNEFIPNITGMGIRLNKCEPK